MRRIKLLWMSDSPTLVSGFGTVTRDILDRLPADRFEIAVVGWAHSGWPYDRTRYPYPIYPSDPRRFGHDSLPNAVSLNATVGTVSRTVGPAIAGILIATLDVAWCFMINAVSYWAVLVMIGTFFRGPGFNFIFPWNVDLFVEL